MCVEVGREYVCAFSREYTPGNIEFTDVTRINISSNFSLTLPGRYVGERARVGGRRRRGTRRGNEQAGPVHVRAGNKNANGGA